MQGRSLPPLFFVPIACRPLDNHRRLPRRYRGLCGMRALGRSHLASPKDAQGPAGRSDDERGGSVLLFYANSVSLDPLCELRVTSTVKWAC